MKWQDKLTKKELRHLRIDAGCRTLESVKRTVEWQEGQRHGNGVRTGRMEEGWEPCFVCKVIGKKLGLIDTA